MLGCVIAGVIIGPHTPPFPLIHDEEKIQTLAELGVVLLMFSLGLEFSLRKLTRVGVPALIAALLEILLLFWVGYEIGRFFRWPFLDSIFLGAMLSMSSTTVIIGAAIAEAREIPRVEALLEPVRDMFSAVFLVAIGLLIDPKLLVTYWQPVVVITLAVLVGKVLPCSFGAFIGGKDTRTSLRVGMGLSQIGEFSFIASLGATLNVTSAFLYPIAVAVSAITTLLTPDLIKSADGAVGWFDRHAPKPLVNSLDLYGTRHDYFRFTGLRQTHPRTRVAHVDRGQHCRHRALRREHHQSWRRRGITARRSSAAVGHPRPTRIRQGAVVPAG